MKRLASLLLTCAVIAPHAVPAQTANAFVDPVQAEVVQGWKMADGTIMAGLRLTLDPGWKTYWRAPGDAGIPPGFGWRGSRNLASVQLTWPQPVVFHENGMRSIGYKDQVVIPLRITPKTKGKDVKVKGRMSLGICSDICVPHTLAFSATLSGDTTKPTPAIAAAMASAPFTAEEAGVRRAACTISPNKDGMQIEARITMPPAGGREETVIESGIPEVWVSEPRTRRQGGDIIAVSQMMHPDGGVFSVNRAAVRITVLGSSHAVDIQGCSAG